MLNALVALYPARSTCVCGGGGCLHVYKQKKTLKKHAHTLSDYCDVLSMLGKVE